MISKDFFKALEIIAEQRGLEKDRVLEVIGRGIKNAYIKENPQVENCTVEFNEKRCEIILKAEFLVVAEVENPGEISLEDAKLKRKTAKIGDVLVVKETPKDFGRLAAGSAKQILTQGLKQLEREKSFNFFKEKEGEMINSQVVAINNDFVTLDLGNNTETSLPKKELLKSDEPFVGERIKVYVTKVDETTKGPKVFVSRTDRNLVKRLIEQTCPEIADGTVEIMGIAREPGERCKISVISHDENVDAIGAVVGVKGSRIKDVLNALDGEKIDIYEWSEDPQQLIINALEPAKIVAINADRKKNKALVIVNDKDLTGAIGNKGINAKLAALSSGWKLDIKPISAAREEGIRYRRIDNEA